jgi:hypothetical protein
MVKAWVNEVRYTTPFQARRLPLALLWPAVGETFCFLLNPNISVGAIQLAVSSQVTSREVSFVTDRVWFLIQ